MVPRRPFPGKPQVLPPSGETPRLPRNTVPQPRRKRSGGGGSGGLPLFQSAAEAHLPEPDLSCPRCAAEFGPDRQRQDRLARHRWREPSGSRGTRRGRGGGTAGTRRARARRARGAARHRASAGSAPAGGASSRGHGAAKAERKRRSRGGRNHADHIWRFLRAFYGTSEAQKRRFLLARSRGCAAEPPPPPEVLGGGLWLGPGAGPGAAGRPAGGCG